MLWPFQVLIKMCSVESDPKTNSEEPQILWYGLCATDTHRLLAGLHVVSLHANHFIETNPLTAKYFMETNPLTVRIFNLLKYVLRDLWTDFLRHLRITQRTWGHTETEGRAFVSSSLTLWYFSSYNKSAGSNTQKRGRQTSWCKWRQLFLLHAHQLAAINFSKHCGVEKQIL